MPTDAPTWEESEPVPQWDDTIPAEDSPPGEPTASLRPEVPFPGSQPAPTERISVPERLARQEFEDRQRLTEFIPKGEPNPKLDRFLDQPTSAAIMSPHPALEIEPMTADDVLKRFPDMTTGDAEIVAGIQRGLSGAWNFMASPMGIVTAPVAATAGAPGVAGLAGKATLGTFAAEAFLNQPEAINRTVEAVRSGDPGKIAQSVTELSVNTLVALGAGKGAIESVKGISAQEASAARAAGMERSVQALDQLTRAEPIALPSPERTALEAARPSPEPLSVPAELRRPNEIQLTEAPTATPEGIVAPPWELPREIKMQVDEGLAAAFEKYQLAKQRQSERATRGEGGKLETSGETFSGLSKTPGFLETAEQKIIKRPASLEPTVEIPEITSSTPLRNVEEIVRDRLEQRDWAGAVSALGQTKAEVSPKIVNKLLGVGKESVPLTVAERTVFNEIWDQALRKSGAGHATRIDSPDLIQRLESLKTPLTPGVGANPFPEIAKAVWNTSLDIAIQAVKAGQHIKIAIDTAVSHMKKNAQGFDEASVRQYLSDILQKETSPAAAKAESAIDSKRTSGAPPPEMPSAHPMRPLGEPYSEPIIERVGRLGKGPVSSKVASEALQIVDHAKRLVGELSVNGLDAAKRAAGALGRDTSWMNDIREITPRSAVGHFHEAMEGRTRSGSFEHVPEHARELAETLWQANLSIGKLAEKASPGFRASGEAQRMLTAYGMDVVRRGGGPAWNAWAEGLAKANDVSVDKVKTFLRRWKSELDSPGFDTSNMDRIAQDFKRQFPNVVTHIKPKVGWHEVVHSSPFRYLEQASQRTAHAAAFREVYSPVRNPETGKVESSGLLNATRKAVMREMETDKHATEFDNLMRALQGHPIDNYSRWWNAPDSPIGATVRALNDALQPIFSGMLSATSFRNIGETLSGGAEIFMGYRRTFEAALKERKLYSDLERSGMVNRAILDFSFDPTSPMRSTSRITSNTIRKVFAEQISNEFQEFVGAAAARVIANEIREGRLPSGDVQNVIATMRAMGIPEASARAAVAGRNEAAVSQFETKAAEFLYGGNRAIAEASPLGASRAFTSLFKWHSYPMTKMRQTRSLINNIIESAEKGDRAQVYANTKLLAKHMGGTAMAGALTTGIMALIYEGTYGAGVRANEAQHDFPGFMLDSYIMAMGGPVQVTARMMEEGGDLGSWVSSLVNAAAPVSVANDLSRAVLGMGNYEGLNPFERTGEFLESKTPFARAIRRGMAVSGLAQDNPDLDTAIRGFRRWRKDKFGFTRFESHLVDDYDAPTFRAHMKKAVTALQKGDREEYDNEINKALELEDVTTRKVKASLRGRKILRRPKGDKLTEEDESELLKIIGDKGMDLLRDFDAMLNTL